jgi:hypothetical protein
VCTLICLTSAKGDSHVCLQCAASTASRLGHWNSFGSHCIADGRSWLNYREKLFQAAEVQDLLGLLDGTKVEPNEPWNPRSRAAWMCDNMEAQHLIITTTPPLIHNHFRLSTTAHEMFEHLKNLFEESMATGTVVVHDVQTCDTVWVAVHAARPLTNRTRTQRVANDEAHTSNGVRNRSGRQCNGLPSKKTENGVGEMGETPRGRVDEEAAAATGPGTATTDHIWTDGVSLATPASGPRDDQKVGLYLVKPPPPTVESTIPTTSQQAHDTAADIVDPHATYTEPTKPAGTSQNPPVESEPPPGQSEATSQVRTPLSKDALDGEAQITTMAVEENGQRTIPHNDDAPGATPEPPPPIPPDEPAQ